MKIWDISPLISEDIAVFPGDVAFQRQISMDMAGGDHLSLSSITTTLHVGAHADAPLHYAREGASIDEVDLKAYVGPCQVISVRDFDAEGRIPASVLSRVPVRQKRVLFQTGSFNEYNTWRDDFSSLSPELIEALSDQGTLLIGIDTPSVDPAKSKALESHQALLRCGVRNLEGLMLKDVPEGDYFLSAAPLKIKGADASPLRALLIDSESSSWLRDFQEAEAKPT